MRSFVVHIFLIRKARVLVFLVGDVIIGVVSHILAEVIGPWASNQWPNFLTQSFTGTRL